MILLGDVDKAPGSEASRRALLFSARLRFASPTQPVRDAAIDRIVQQNLLLVDADSNVTPRELCAQGAFTLADGTQVLQIADVEESLQRMALTGTVHSAREGSFRLSVRTREALDAERKANQHRLDRVLTKHLKGSRGSRSINGAALLNCMAMIFSKLGEGYARLLQGEVDALEVARGPLVKDVLEDLTNGSPEADQTAVKAGVISFLEDLSPDAAHMKWNLAQNYYVAKALGLDPEGRLLSDEVFGSAEVYLDTNVVIPALEPRAQHHANFQSLARACRGLDGRLCVCQVTVDETRSSIGIRRAELEKVMDEIPDKLASRVSSDFFRIVRTSRDRGEEIDLDDLFAPYEEPSRTLSAEFGTELVDHQWFVEEAESAATAEVAEKVSEAWKMRTGRSKAAAVARHDALLLRWVARRRMEEPNSTSVLVTRDHTLSDVQMQSEGDLPLVMMLDVFVQWVSPAAMRAVPDTEFSDVFSEAIKYELLPQENFFDLKDFLVFHEMEMSCKELPVEDVESCLRHLKAAMPHLDPRRAEDREKLTSEINRFLVSPGRKFRLDVERLEREKAEEQEAAQSRLDEERREAQERLEEKDRELVSSRSQINDLQVQAEEKRARALRDSALRRLLLCLIGLLLSLGAMVWWAFESAADDDSIWDVVSSAGEIIGLLVISWIAAGWFVLGKDRIDSLGWSVKKLFGEK